MTALVNDLLDVSRVTRGLVTLSREALDIEGVVHEAVEQVRPLIDSRGHQLQIDLPDDLPLVRADPQAVRTALGQLLENAFKYSPDGGVVAVTARLRPDGRSVEVSVADEGIGLAPGEIDYLFMAFYQGETRARSKVRGGVGLGLSIVRRLVEAMGGEVGAEGQPGGGPGC